MAIITKPNTVLKGTPNIFSLSKAELLALPIVQNDEYFSDMGNWNRVNLKFRSSIGKQYELVEFNATLENPTGIFSVSARAKNFFQIVSIEIFDFDGGVFVVPRSSLNTSHFDVKFPVMTLDFSNPASYAGKLSGAVINSGVLVMDNNATGFFLTTGLTVGTSYSVRIHFTAQTSGGASDSSAALSIQSNASVNISSSDLRTYSGGYVEKTYTQQNVPVFGIGFKLVNSAGNLVDITKIEIF